MKTSQTLCTPIAIVLGSLIIGGFIYLGLQNGVSSQAQTINNGFSNNDHVTPIQREEIENKLPQNYQIYDYYYEDLDNDGIEEVIVLLEEEEKYITEESHGPDIDAFREKPVQIMVFDFVNGIWVATEATVVSNSDWQGQHVFQPYNLSTPYKFVEKQPSKWLVILTGHASFDGFAISPSIFIYDQNRGLQRIETSNELWGDKVFVKDSKIYFTVCNPFFNKGIEAYELDLNSSSPKLTSIDLSNQITCEFLWTNSEIGIFPDFQEKTEKLFNAKGITFPLN